MPYDVTTDFKEEQVKLEQDQLIEMFVLDLASIQGYVSFYSSTKKIISRDRDGIFPSSRIKVGDVLAVRGTVNNNATFTITDINAYSLTVSESVTDEGLTSPVLASFSNYTYYVKYQHDVYGYKLQAGEIINTNQLYTATSIKREEVGTEQRLSSGQFKLSVGNVNRIMEGFVQNRKYLRGCFIYVITFFQKHLPSGGTYEYVGSSPDYLSHIIEKFVVDGTESNEMLMVFNCKYKFDLRQINLPRRKLETTYCSWAERYGCTECDPTGSIDYVTYPTCDGSLVQCRLRGNARRYGGFPGVPRQSIYV